MTLTSLEIIVKALNKHNIRYLIVGGLAVAAHGYGRVTLDVDLVIELLPDNARLAIETLSTLGYKPIAPVDALDFADAEKRREWIEHKNMVVFSLYSDEHPLTPVDLFVSEPFDFNIEYDRATVGELLEGENARFVCLETLIDMKKATGRPKDDEDARQLQLIVDHLNGKA